MRAMSLEELQVYQKALSVAHEVSALLKRPCFRNDRRLFDQLSASSDSCPSLISDGFAQSTDRFFAVVLSLDGRGQRDTDAELEALCVKYEELERMLASLERSDWKNRGAGTDE